MMTHPSDIAGLSERLRTMLESEIDSLTARVKELEAKLFPYADAHEISGMSWSGFYLIGDKKSISEVRRLENRSSQLEQYTSQYEERIAATEARALRAEQQRDEAYERAAKVAETFWQHGLLQHNGTKRGIATAIRRLASAPEGGSVKMEGE